MNLTKLIVLAALAAPAVAGRAFAAPPVNDLCENAIEITPGAYYGTTAEATGSGFVGCGVPLDSPDVWFKLIPGATGSVRLNTAGSSFPTVLEFYSACPPGNQTGCSYPEIYTPDIGDGFGSELNFNTSVSAPRWIRITSPDKSSGEFILTITDPAVQPPPAINCSWRAQFPSADSTVSGNAGLLTPSVVGDFYSATSGDAVEETIFGDRPAITGLRLNLVVPHTGPTNNLAPGAQMNWNVLVNGQQVGTITFDQNDIDALEYNFGPFAPIPGPNYTVRLEVAADLPSGQGSLRLGYAGPGQGYVTLTSDPTFAINASQRGMWDSDGVHEAANNGTFSGYAGGIGVTRNAYFSFPSVKATGAIDAKLRLEVSGYASPDPSESFTIYQVATDPATLEADGVSMAVFNDLQDGTALASFTVSAADVGTVLEIPLVDINKTANMMLGLQEVISLGLHCTTAPTSGSTQGASFSINDEARTHQLVLNFCPYDGRAFGDFDNSNCTDLNDFLYLLDYWSVVAPIGGEAIGLNDFLSLLDYWNTGAGCI